VSAHASTRAPGRLAEAARTVWGLLVVLAAAGALLAALDAIPTLVGGQPREVRRARAVDDVERRLRARLVLPAYFPARLAWPPQQIRYVVSAPGAVALTVAVRGEGAGLLLAQTIRPGRIPPQLLPEAQEFDRSPVPVGPAMGVLSRVIEDGEMRWQLAWQQGGRSLLLRSAGSVDELLRMARSAREAP
jgi:hypothetical protein